MVKKSFFKRNEVKVGFLALGFIILFGIVAGISDIFVPGFDAIPFTVNIDLENTVGGIDLEQFLGRTIPLSFAENLAIECRIWVQGDIIDVGGGITDIGFSTQTFNPQFQLDVINIRTEREISSIEPEIRIRCDPVGANLNPDFSSYTLTGGTLQYYWTAVDEGTDLKNFDDTTIRIGNIVNVPIQSSDNVLQDSGGGGITIASPKISGTEIDNALSSPLEVYFSNVGLVITAKPEFNFKLFTFEGTQKIFVVDQKETAIVSLNAGVGNIKVFNQVVDAPTPTSQLVKLQSVVVDPSPLFDDSTNIDLEVRIRLAQCPDGACGSPRVDVFQPTSSGANILKSVPITAKKLVDASTDTYEFFDTNIEIPNNPRAGNWIIIAKHDVRTGTDTGQFTVLEKGTQEEEPPVIECVGDDCPKEEEEEEEENGGMSDFLSIGKFIDCLEDFSKTQKTSCLNDSAFFLIYGIIAIVVLLSVVGGRR